MAEPTPQDIRNAEFRAAIADRFRTEYAIAAGYALSLFGPGWEPHGFSYLVDSDEASRLRYSKERPRAVATVFTATHKGEKRHFVVENGTARAVESVEAGLPMLHEPHPTRRITVRGEEVAPARYELCWGWLENAKAPRTADQLAAARERREAKAVEAEAKDSLFADAIRAEGPVRRSRSK